MAEVRVELGERSYSVLVGWGLLQGLAEALEPLGFSRRCLLVTNTTVEGLYASQVTQGLAEAGWQVKVAALPDGEGAKTLEQAAALYDLALEAGLDRRSPLITLGGGVVGDLGGFVAATYMRGLPLVHLPTSLLAQVDASIGGKVAVDHPRAKNLIGAFHQPSLVLADLSTLATLPDGELVNGLAEVVKYGMVWDETIFTFLEDQANREAVLAREAGAMEYLVGRCVAAKAEVVAIDEREAGRRSILNYGHTFGHALETLGGYRELAHGQAVAIGMVQAAALAANLTFFGGRDLLRLRHLLAGLGLPGSLPAGVTPEQVVAAMATDKKNRDGHLTLVLPRAIGLAETISGFSPEDVLENWRPAWG